MYSKTDDKKQELALIVDTAIERVNKKHYLGSSNHKTNPTGGLNGYYRNVAARVYKDFCDKNGLISPLFYVYLMDACITYTGSGNCGELAGALYLDLFQSNLSVKQKRLIQIRSYPTKDEHRENSYVLVNSTVFDIWAGKKYKQARIKAMTGVAERLHTVRAVIDPEKSLESIEALKKITLTKFSTRFEEELAKDRKEGRMYVTFNSKDPSDYALWASDAFPYLFRKFNETVEDPYFIVHQDEAKLIQGKIIKDCIYLIEELRQDFPAIGFISLLHKGKIKYTHQDITAKLNHLIPAPHFVAFILAVSYKNSQPQLALELLINLQSILNVDSKDKLELVLVATVSTEISSLTSVANMHPQSVDTSSVITIQQDNTDVPSTAVISEEGYNPQHFFAESSKSSAGDSKNEVELDGSGFSL